MKALKYLIKKAIGHYRLFWGNCPACNSDAPAMYDCRVCEWYREPFYPLHMKKKKVWKHFESYLIEERICEDVKFARHILRKEGLDPDEEVKKGMAFIESLKAKNK